MAKPVHPDLVEAFRIGAQEGRNPYLWSSPCWEACESAIRAKAAGEVRPVLLHAGRASYRVGRINREPVTYRFTYARKGGVVTVETI